MADRNMYGGCMSCYGFEGAFSAGAGGMMYTTLPGGGISGYSQYTLLQNARNGDVSDLQQYAYQNASPFTGHVDFIGEASFWSLHYLDGNVVGATSYAQLQEMPF